ncbi:hypothetical protein Tco_1025231 [Tanacetum coccineum]
MPLPRSSPLHLHHPMTMKHHLFLEFYDELSDKPQELPPPQMSPNDPYAQTMDNWPPGPSNPSSPRRVSRPPLGFPNPPPGFEPLPSAQPLFVNINNNIPLLHNNALPLENIHYQPPNLRNQDFPNPLNILDFVHPNDMPHLTTCFVNVVAPQGMKSKCSETVSTTCLRKPAFVCIAVDMSRET